MTAAPPPPKPPQKQFSCGLMILLALLILAACALFIFWRVETWPMRMAGTGSAELERLAGKVRDAFVDLGQLQPRVTINDRVYMEQSAPVAELALVSRQIGVDHEFMHTWAGSTKRVRLHGSYSVKAGFDLRNNFTVDLRDDAIIVHLPRAKILSIEQEKVEVLAFENGLWNRISAADLQKEFAAVPKLARDKAEAAGLAAEAETSLQEQLQQRLGMERPLQVIFDPGPPTKD
ncbi:hypothetical protein BH20VER2_BH20VER2_04570 [soil metagenome]|nr:DUF4230 domain-containing protein [Chthoniobacterales bacterium]